MDRQIDEASLLSLESTYLSQLPLAISPALLESRQQTFCLCSIRVWYGSGDTPFIGGGDVGDGSMKVERIPDDDPTRRSAAIIKDVKNSAPSNSIRGNLDQAYLHSAISTSPHSSRTVSPAPLPAASRPTPSPLQRDPRRWPSRLGKRKAKGERQARGMRGFVHLMRGRVRRKRAGRVWRPSSMTFGQE